MTWNLASSTLADLPGRRARASSTTALNWHAGQHGHAVCRLAAHGQRHRHARRLHRQLGQRLARRAAPLQQRPLGARDRRRWSTGRTPAAPGSTTTSSRCPPPAWPASDSTVTVTACADSSQPLHQPVRPRSAARPRRSAPAPATLAATTVTFNAAGVATHDAQPSAARPTAARRPVDAVGRADAGRECRAAAAPTAVAAAPPTAARSPSTPPASSSPPAAAASRATAAGADRRARPRPTTCCAPCAAAAPPRPARPRSPGRADRELGLRVQQPAHLLGQQPDERERRHAHRDPAQRQRQRRRQHGGADDLRRQRQRAVQLHLATTSASPPSGSSKTVDGAPLAGNSNAFVVTAGALRGLGRAADARRPTSPTPARPTPSGARFVQAGESFGATVTAQTSGGATTPNFGRETTPEGVRAHAHSWLPSGGASGTLANGSIAGGSFSAGVATLTNLAYSEVGIITLTPSGGRRQLPRRRQRERHAPRATWAASSRRASCSPAPR
ncbi:MAG: hypothetical protein MZW92_57975 [Comamonadaceae bacterium]|nr:hypothetical protein [Comamonadaceae bacterium]